MTGLGMENAARLVVIPALRWMAERTGEARLSSPQACCLLLAIGAQESGWRWRRQRPVAWAKSHYQIETATAVAVLNKWDAGRRLWSELFPERPFTSAKIGEAVELSEVGATLIARGIPWLTPHRLPNVDEADEAYAWWLYSDPKKGTWRPGKPHPEFWPGNWRQAVETTVRCW